MNPWLSSCASWTIRMLSGRGRRWRKQLNFLYNKSSLFFFHHRLSLGRLSPFGRFYPETEPLPDKKAGSVFSKAVRKFVLAEDQVRTRHTQTVFVVLIQFFGQENEEAAWHAAEMIVRDVIAITLREIPFKVSSCRPAVNVTWTPPGINQRNCIIFYASALFRQVIPVVTYINYCKLSFYRPIYITVTSG